MLFAELMDLLRHQVRVAVWNGRLTERGLAMPMGISQPYLHNVLKGHRPMTAELADRLMRELRIEIADLVPPPPPLASERLQVDPTTASR
ncbi:MAG: XRE family transcriptional regulator [Acidobacteria bacterium]|nr:XRE family transcriptional regulator [Acidobacteriota bacterium]